MALVETRSSSSEGGDCWSRSVDSVFSELREAIMAIILIAADLKGVSATCAVRLQDRSCSFSPLHFRFFTQYIYRRDYIRKQECALILVPRRRCSADPKPGQALLIN